MFAIAVGVLLALLAFPRRAGAHALLVRSQPANGSIVAVAPPVVQLWFDEEISPALSSARLVDRSGVAVAGTRAEAGRTDPRLLEMAEPVLGPGTYGVLWQVLAEDDGHASSGTVVFSVGAANGPLTMASSGGGTAATPLDVTRRWIGVSLLAGLIGGLAMTGLVLARIGRPEAAPLASTIRTARRRILAVAAGCAAAGALVGVVDAIEEARRLSTPAQSWTATLGDLVFSTRWGQLWLVRGAALILLVPTVLVLRARSEPDRHRTKVPTTVSAALVLTLVWTEALGSHAATASSARRAAVVSDAVHILAACVWLGALPALVLLLRSSDADARIDRAALVRACRGPFSRLVAASVGLVLVTGLYNAGREVESVGDLVSTSYGRTLLVKSGLLILMIGLGLVNAARLHGIRRFGSTATFSRRLVGLEAVVGAALLIAVGVLVNTAPSRGGATSTESPGLTRNTSVADVFITVSATPNRPGINGFTVLAASSRRPPPAPIDGITLELSGDRGRSLVQLAPTAPGSYFGTGQLDTAGEVTLRAVLSRGGTRLTATIQWQVGGTPDTRPVSVRRLAPYVDGLGLTLIVTAAGVGLGWAMRRRRRRRPTEPMSPPPTTAPRIETTV